MEQFFSSSEYTRLCSEADQFLRKHFDFRRDSIHDHSPQLLEAMEYSLFSGGKRFRPVLSLYVMQGLDGETSEALPWAAALEMIHTYSLIHDDLPCMDNDDLRRGKPTSHKKYGEALALLAGDALLTESFFILAKHYASHPELGSLVQLLSASAGASGMVGAQAMDMGQGHPITTIEDIQKMHSGKTGALITAAVQGPGLIQKNSSTSVRSILKTFGDQIGLAFQIKDDLLDMEKDPRSYIYHLGLEGTQAALDTVSRAAEETLGRLPKSCSRLLGFIKANSERNN
jgi:geranylgeranyl diphosphate synthase, type II